VKASVVSAPVKWNNDNKSWGSWGSKDVMLMPRAVAGTQDTARGSVQQPREGRGLLESRISSISCINFLPGTHPSTYFCDINE